MKKKNPKHSYNPRPIDRIMQSDFLEAMSQTEDLPLEDQWGIVLELLPEKFHYYVLVASQQPEMVMMDRIGLLAYILIKQHFEEEPSPKFILTALHGLLISSLAEIERKELLFCESVDAIREPFLITFPGNLPFHPKDPDNFDVRELILHHIQRYEGDDL